ncbi:MAG: pantoate--beta-alanine ligase [Lachnospiraceae bacterium]|nr:pantoate--beta-alanine ligase [Lachnospiraceae bacterium]
MKIVTTVEGVREQVKAWRKEGKTVGLVPTMGYLHEGHKSLIDRAVKENDEVVVSVFVNPMQFGPTEDLDSYPRDLAADAKLCEAAGASIIFHPEPEEMYKDGFCSFVDMSGLTNALCGLSRPVHFRGVCTVVTKLFNIVTPDRAYFGEKDAQQLAVVKRMVRDLNMPLEIVGCPIIREADGLAKSSRNTYLPPEARQQALVLSKSIFLGKKMVEDGERDPEKVKQAMREVINTAPLADIDYVEIVDVNTMKSVDVIKGEILCAIAVKMGSYARLIDNFMMTV